MKNADKFGHNKHIKHTQNVVQERYRRGLNVIQSDENKIQIMPPLTTPKEILEKGLQILVESIVKVSRKSK